MQMQPKMSKKLQEYLSKIKKQSPPDHLFPKNHKKLLPKMFSGCHHPHKTLSFSIDQNYTLPRHHPRNPERGEATLSDVDKFLIENFKSLYDDASYIEADKNYSCHTKSCKDDGDLCGSAVLDDGSACSSDSTNANANANANNALIMRSGEKDPTVPDECIVVLKLSSTLYDDFRDSMKEMIEARVENGASADEEFLQEMLLCFLNLNDKKYYRYIVSAFMNLTSDLRRI